MDALKAPASTGFGRGCSPYATLRRMAGRSGGAL